MAGGVVGDIQVPISSAHPANSRAGEGDFNVTGGGNQTVLYIVIGLVATMFIFAVVWAVSRIKKGKKK